MVSEMISRQFNEFCKIFTGNLPGLPGVDKFHEQWRNMFGMFQNTPSWVPKMDNALMDNWLKICQDATQNFLQCSPSSFQAGDPKGMMNQFVDETRRAFRLAGLDQVEQVTDSVGALESRVASMQARDYTEEIQSVLTEDSSLARKDDVKGLKKSITELKKGMVGTREISSLRKSLDHLETDLKNQKEALASIKDLVAGMESKLATLSSAGSIPAKPAATQETPKSSKSKKTS